MSDPGARLYAALGVPATAQVDRRVAKSALVERGGLSSADKKVVDAGVERLMWRSTLTPQSVALRPLVDDTRDYSQMVAMSAILRPGAAVDRLADLIHRAIAHPLTLILQTDAAACLSVGLKRRHEREAGRVVMERLSASPGVHDGDDQVETAFLNSLNLAVTGAGDLWSLHTRWGERIEAFSAARITGRFRPPVDSQDAERRREALVQHGAASRDLERLRKRARSERQLNRRIALANEVAREEGHLADLETLLA